MFDLDTPAQASLYLWDYFAIRHAPLESERRAWRRIECAAIRIQESEQMLRDGFPAAVRVKNARRVRRACREILRLSTGVLEELPDRRVASALGMLEGIAQRIIDTESDAARAEPLH